MQIDLMVLLLEGKHGTEFQDYCERYLEAKYGEDFQRVDAYGSDGDGSKDGYCVSTREYFAMSTATKLPKKIKTDFAGCIEKNPETKIFTFVTNQKQTPKFLETVEQLRKENPHLKIGTLTHKTIAAEIFAFPQNKIKMILGRDVDLSENTVYFDVEKDSSATFKMSEGIGDSLYFYILLAVMAILFGVTFKFFHSNEALMSLIFLAIIALLLLYMYKNEKKLKKYKAAHKILYLVLSEKLPVGAEILFQEVSHKTIRRNARWNFTSNRRSIDCTKTGCNGKVYIHPSEEFTLIGKCQKDPVNHIYKIDNNFYGEPL